MTADTICSDFGAQKNSLLLFSLFPHLLAIKVMGPDAKISLFWILSLSQLFHSLLSSSSRHCLVPLRFLPKGWCHLHIWDYWHFSQQSWLHFVLHPARHFTFHSAYKLNKQGVPEASVRNPACDKVMRKEADICKACSDFRGPSGNS